MAADLLDFLKKNFIDDLEAASNSSSWSNVPCPDLLAEISNELKKMSFSRDKTQKAIDLLYDLNNLLDDCVMFEEKTETRAHTTKNLHKRIRFPSAARCSTRNIRRECEATKNKLCYTREIREKLKTISKDLRDLQSTEKSPSDGIETSSISVIRREGFPYFVKSEVCGFGDRFKGFDDSFVVPLDYFKNFIIQNNQCNVAMAFVGIGGSGKSTLARMIFFDEDVQRVFNNVVLWVDCSQVPDSSVKLSCITVEMFRHTASPCQYTLEGALRSLHDIIRDRRCLVVLDGVWISDGIKTFLDVVTRQLHGTIIITTRLNKVADDLVDKEKIFFSDRFCVLESEGAKKEEGKETMSERAKKEDQMHAYCWAVFEETLKRKKFRKEIKLHEDSRITELANVIKSSSLGNPLAAKTLAEVISQRICKTGYWAEDPAEQKKPAEQKIVKNWQFLLKVDVYDHLSLSKVWYKVLSTQGVVKESSYFRKNEISVTSKCHPREVLRALRDVCHVEFISIS